MRSTWNAGILLLLALLFASLSSAQTFRVATYNLESYLDEPVRARPAKSPEAKAKINECIRALKPDIIALQEAGSLSAVRELQASLKAEGLDLPHSEFVNGHDTNIHVAVLSRFPFTARRPHTNDAFLLGGRRFKLSRGFADLDIQISAGFSCSLIAAHLKSKRPVPEADEAELRLEEAKKLREVVDDRFAADAAANLIVLGDFNDTKDSPPIRAILGRGKLRLIDIRPAERNGDAPESTRSITWTEHYAKEDVYSRIDYILLSPAMARHWVPAETYILALPNWGVASDHRPLVATFEIMRN